jgi:hypothetical protein
MIFTRQLQILYVDEVRNGKTVIKLVTPKLLAAAKDHF